MGAAIVGVDAGVIGAIVALTQVIKRRVTLPDWAITLIPIAWGLVMSIPATLAKAAMEGGAAPAWWAFVVEGIKYAGAAALAWKVQHEAARSRGA